MRTAEEIVKEADLSLGPSESLLWNDPEHTLLMTPFKATGNLSLDRDWLIYWWMYLYIPDDRLPQGIWSSYDNGLRPIFKYASTSGYVIATNQASVRIAAIRSAPLQKQVEELSLWIPHIRSIDLEKVTDRETRKSSYRGKCKTLKYVKIFEHTLSAHASYSLDILDDNVYNISSFSYRLYVENSFTNLPDAVDYIRKNHYYEG